MKKFVIGDIHGAFKALLQVLERASFDYSKDVLIVLGDICDGWSETAECVEELLKIKNLIQIEGNHDQWFLDYQEHRLTRDGIENWFKFGGDETVKSYQKNSHLLNKHIEFFKKAVKYHVDNKDRVFVHAGIANHHDSLDMQYDYCWTSHFYKNAIIWHKQNFKVSPIIKTGYANTVNEWFVGHVPTSNFKHQNGKNVPLKFSNINFLDTGAAYDGVLTIMNIETYQYFQSDIVKQMYPDEKGRNKMSYKDEMLKKKEDSTDYQLW